MLHSKEKVEIKSFKKRITVRYSPAVYGIIFGALILNLFFINKYSLALNALIVYVIYDYFKKKKLINEIDVKINAKARVFANEHFYVKFFLKSKKSAKVVLTPPLLISKEQKMIELEPGREKIVIYESAFGTRGTKPLGTYSLKLNGLGKIFSVIRVEELDSDIKVLPQIEESNVFVERILETVPVLKSSFKLAEDVSYIRDITEYNNEPMNRIHWKQSAKYDKLMAKNYEYAGTSKVYILLDLNLPCGVYSKNAWFYIRKKYEEDAIKATAGLINLFSFRHEETSLVISHKDGIKSIFEKDLAFKYDQLAEVSGTIENDLDSSELITEILNIVQPIDTIIILTMFLTKQEVERIIELKKRCGRVIVLVMPYGYREGKSKKFKTYYDVPPQVRELYKYAHILRDENVLIEIWHENVSLSEGLISLMEER